MGTVKEKPILFSAPMILAILAGQKTMTRRVVNPQPDDHRWSALPGYAFSAGTYECTDGFHARFQHRLDGVGEQPLWVKSPYGSPGDELWVRENFSGPSSLILYSPGRWHEKTPIHYWADGKPLLGDWTNIKPSIHLPRKFSRIQLSIPDIRIERLQDITEADAISEGIEKVGDFIPEWKIYGSDGCTTVSPVESFQSLWDSINGKPKKDDRDYSWARNPWVWVVSFKRVTACK